MREHLEHCAPLWRWTGNGQGAWYFVTIAGPAADQLTSTALMRRLEGSGRGFGSLKVTATIGESRWQTSVFPQKADDGRTEWLLPIKAAIRKAEDLTEGAPVALALAF